MFFVVIGVVVSSVGGVGPPPPKRMHSKAAGNALKNPGGQFPSGPTGALVVVGTAGVGGGATRAPGEGTHVGIPCPPSAVDAYSGGQERYPN
jgi:hypothetical protein